MSRDSDTVAIDPSEHVPGTAHSSVAVEITRYTSLLRIARHQVLDTLPGHIALLDADGIIIHMNAGWQRFAERHAVALQQADVGGNYLAVCEAADEAQSHGVAQALRAILAGEREQLKFEYPCATPDGERWFCMVACGVPGGAEGPVDAAALVMHLDITEPKQAEQDLVRMAYHDQLTGLPSRNAFVERLEREVPASDEKLARYVLILDIQELRAVNDTYGYESGDQMLIGIATALQRAVMPHEHVARIGGDQFAVYLDPRAHVLHDGALAETIARWVDNLVSRTFAGSGYRIDIGAWTGIARVHAGDTPADLIRRAALAMHMARQRPIGRALMYDGELETQVRERARITRALHRAIERDEFDLDYQPNVRQRDGTISSAEALIRWDDPERGRQQPASFIPIARPHA